MEDGPPGFPRGFTCPAVLRGPLECRKVSHTGLSPSVEDLSRSFCYPLTSHIGALQPPKLESPGFGLIRVRSPLLTESLLISSPPGTEMFQFPGFAPCQKQGDPVLPGPGFPIRTPPDQNLFSGSPKFFAAYHVLHRLSAPRHPPSALTSLTNPSFHTRQSHQTRSFSLFTPIRLSKITKNSSALESCVRNTALKT